MEGMTGRPVRTALSSSFGFGGSSVCAAIRRFDG
jgi:3-oxoacyl-(acyl-carrier-protein) synthase